MIVGAAVKQHLINLIQELNIAVIQKFLNDLSYQELPGKQYKLIK